MRIYSVKRYEKEEGFLKLLVFTSQRPRNYMEIFHFMDVAYIGRVIPSEGGEVENGALILYEQKQWFLEKIIRDERTSKKNGERCYVSGIVISPISDYTQEKYPLYENAIFRLEIFHPSESDDVPVERWGWNSRDMAKEKIWNVYREKEMCALYVNNVEASLEDFLLGN